MSKILPVIMCGGSGTRMWPESRESLPKQFIPLFGTHSTFQDTVMTFADANVFERPLVLTNIDYRFLVAEQLAQVGVAAEIVLEPVRRDSAAAVAIAAEIARRRSPETVVAVLAADHSVRDRKRFAELCRQAGEAAASGLETATELALARKLMKFPEAILLAAGQMRPHFLCLYLYELAGEFSAFYNADKVAVDDPSVRARRLLLCARTLLILETGLHLLGLRTLERM